MTQQEKQLRRDTPTDSAKQRSPYDVLIRQSQKMGTVATHTFGEVNRFLQQQVSLPPRDELMSSISLSPKSKDKVRTHVDIDTLKKSVLQSHEVLCNVQTVFPITLFPDSIMMDRTKITITKRSFFWSSEVISIQIEDVLNVSSNVGPFFGSLTIASRVMSTVDHFTVNNFWRKDAIDLKRMIYGHLIAKQNKIDTSSLSLQELVETIMELGTDTATEA